jgi:predicted transcriptional regulator
MTSIDLQLPDEQAARLDRFASSVHKSRNQDAA